ncbi:NUDIX domain-containing protein [Chromobacterium sp. IIBBL 290-4]|uniref:NUDIX domain-containing protein n=1 Tax=Chromobacterium sp. IIBBL 290-4 TaxID=2953890 RepID=UPI0020B642C6|nr:NUDIX domain-containing protein [Chromobacterium sp. IIBBL 290-4]UTH75949.1 NUDIX domain-containing protein [Chromobacterium sp. IIBBL 290-4]
MKHRIAAGAIVEDQGRVLMVRRCKPGAYDFWAAPGGGAIDDEALAEAAAREVREECGLRVEIGALLCIEEFASPETRECKFWFRGRLLGGEIDCGAEEATREHIVEAAWLSREDFVGKTVFPPMLLQDDWREREQNLAAPRYVGLRRMEFY